MPWFCSKCRKNRPAVGLRQDLRWGANSVLRDPLAGIKGGEVAGEGTGWRERGGNGWGGRGTTKGEMEDGEAGGRRKKERD